MRLFSSRFKRDAKAQGVSRGEMISEADYFRRHAMRTARVLKDEEI